MKYGCKLSITFSNIISYADDIVFLSPSVTGVQILIDKSNITFVSQHYLFNFIHDLYNKNQFGISYRILFLQNHENDLYDKCTSSL